MISPVRNRTVAACPVGSVMAGLVPGIHAPVPRRARVVRVDARHKAGHDNERARPRAANPR